MSRPRRRFRPKRRHRSGGNAERVGTVAATTPAEDAATGVPHADRPAKVRPDVESQRLQKVLAAAGVGSRRRCEELILAGRVMVDGEVVDALGARVDSARQRIDVDGEPLRQPRRVYFALNKPAGVLSTNRDPAGRRRAIDLVPDPHRLFTIGRLDQHSEGLILLTNDGALADRLTHPRYGVEKTYRVQVAGRPGGEVIAQLRKGVYLAEGVVRARRVSFRRRHKNSTLLEIVLCEGKNREIRRMLAALGHKVQRLVRIAVGPLRLGDLPLGAYRPLKEHEVRALWSAALGRRAPQRRFERPRWVGGARRDDGGPAPQGRRRLPRRRKRRLAAIGKEPRP